MMRLIALLLLLASATASLASPEPESSAYSACLQSALSGVAILECMDAELERVDRQLNRNYHRAMSEIQPFRRDELRRVQRLWIRYRDARCGFFNHRESGSGGRLDEMQCRIDETARRAQELAEIY
jgi:uncharacterized protein YecT (DUF1311 family)